MKTNITSNYNFLKSKFYVLCSLLFLMCCTTNKNTIKNKATFDVQGHRGCRGLMPENTIPAMLKAINIGVNTLEMDVVFTKDEVAILSHEPFFNAQITTLPNGKFIAENEDKNYNIYKMTFAETQRYDVGLKPHPRFTQQQKIAVTKPSLSNLIDSVEKYVTINKLPTIFYNIETKTTPQTDNIFHPTPEVFVTLLMKVIRAKNIESKVIIQSFDRRTLQVLHKKYPAIKTALLVEAYDKNSFRKQLNDLGFSPSIYSPNEALVNPNLIQACHQKNIKIIPWTVNDKQKIIELKAMGVDGIITDYPNLIDK